MEVSATRSMMLGQLEDAKRQLTSLNGQEGDARTALKW